MKWSRTVVAAIALAAIVWLSITVLEPLGRSGLAGGVVRNNIEKQTDATGLFYTDIDPRALRGGRD